MVKQVEWKDEQGASAANPVPSGTELANSQQSNPKTSSISTQIYNRLGLTMPRWLFWILTVVVGTTMSGLLVAALALWTPLWSTIDRTEEELQWSGKDEQNTPLPGDLWSNLSQYKLKRPMNILVMGIEPVPGAVDGSPESFSGSSDTILLVRLNPETETINVLSIPRDTMISIPEKGLTKVSQANTKGGGVLAVRTISRTLGNVAIDRYVRISNSGLRQLVDQLGGVEVYVPYPMQYQDTTQRFGINLVQGWQNLNGEQAEQFVRYRQSDLGDLPRVQNQQSLLMALRDRLASPTVVPRLPQLIRVMRKNVDTNLKLEEMMAIVNFSANTKRDGVRMTILPGIFSRLSADPNSYWLDLTGQTQILSEYAGVNLGGVGSASKPITSLRIAVQNASQKTGKTEQVVGYLKQKGFANAFASRDWEDTQRETQIIVQRGNRQLGEQLREIFGFGNVEVLSTGDIQSDITIRVGKDWQ